LLIVSVEKATRKEEGKDTGKLGKMMHIVYDYDDDTMNLGDDSHE